MIDVKVNTNSNYVWFLQIVSDDKLITILKENCKIK